MLWYVNTHCQYGLIFIVTGLWNTLTLTPITTLTLTLLWFILYSNRIMEHRLLVVLLCGDEIIDNDGGSGSGSGGTNGSNSSNTTNNTNRNNNNNDRIFVVVGSKIGMRQSSTTTSEYHHHHHKVYCQLNEVVTDVVRVRRMVKRVVERSNTIIGDHIDIGNSGSGGSSGGGGSSGSVSGSLHTLRKLSRKLTQHQQSVIMKNIGDDDDVEDDGGGGGGGDDDSDYGGGDNDNSKLKIKKFDINSKLKLNR